MFFLPNSLAKLWESALIPNLPIANALVVVLPLIEAVAPVKMRVPRFLEPPFPPSLGCSKSFFENSSRTSLEKAKAARALVSNDSRTSSSVISRNGFHVPYPALNNATRSGEVDAEKWFLMLENAERIEAGV